MTGIILAGGKSRRMGGNKAFIDAGGVPLIERVYRVLREIFPEVIIVANDAHPFEMYDARLQKDIILQGGIKMTEDRKKLFGRKKFRMLAYIQFTARMGNKERQID